MSAPAGDAPNPSNSSSPLRAAGAEAGAPMVTVILPIRNEADHIEACLERMLEQDYPSGLMEILVIDGRSTDGTVEVVRQVQARHPTAVLRVVENPAQIVPPALNIGIRQASGNIIVRMDGHSFPAKDYVARCVDASLRSGAANVGGVIEPVGMTRFGRAVATATAHWLGAGDARYRIGGAAGFVDNVNFGAFRRDAFVKVGLFDESLVRNQDDEMNMRFRAAGERVYLDPAIRVQYTPRSTVKGLWSQYFQYGWWRIETMKRHPQLVRWRQLVPPAVTGALAVGAIAAPFSSLAAVGVGVAAVGYATLLGGVAWRIAPNRADAGHVALAFAVLHLGYGFGFLTHVLSGGRIPYRASPPHIPQLDARPNEAATSATGASAPT